MARVNRADQLNLLNSPPSTARPAACAKNAAFTRLGDCAFDGLR